MLVIYPVNFLKFIRQGLVSSRKVASQAHMTKLSREICYVIDESSSSYLHVRRQRAALEPMG